MVSARWFVLSISSLPWTFADYVNSVYCEQFTLQNKLTRRPLKNSSLFMNRSSRIQTSGWAAFWRRVRNVSCCCGLYGSLFSCLMRWLLSLLDGLQASEWISEVLKGRWRVVRSYCNCAMLLTTRLQLQRLHLLSDPPPKFPSYRPHGDFSKIWFMVSDSSPWNYMW
jgi:hypothetical protein